MSEDQDFDDRMWAWCQIKPSHLSNKIPSYETILEAVRIILKKSRGRKWYYFYCF